MSDLPPGTNTAQFKKELRNAAIPPFEGEQRVDEDECVPVAIGANEYAWLPATAVESLFEHLPTVFTHAGDEGEERVTIVGTIHRGEQTVETVVETLSSTNPDIVAAEWSPDLYAQYRLLGLNDETLEMAVAEREARQSGARFAPIDRTLVARDLKEATTGSRQGLISALSVIARWACILLLSALIVGNLALGNYPRMFLNIGFLVAFFAINYALLRSQFNSQSFPNETEAFVSAASSFLYQPVERKGREDIEAWRDAKMTRRIKELRTEGEVVAIMGYAHACRIIPEIAPSNEWSAVTDQSRWGNQEHQQT